MNPTREQYEEAARKIQTAILEAGQLVWNVSEEEEADGLVAFDDADAILGELEVAWAALQIGTTESSSSRGLIDALITLTETAADIDSVVMPS